MRKSDIFESFIKIAQEKGLISKAEAEHTEKNTRNPRWDSLSIEQIGKLYGVKPDLPEDMKYEKNIMEDAHPESVVISPSYDKLNGLVENENEGQNIRARIVMKDPDGHLTNRKYAEQQLLLSLVRVANDLDNRDQDDLRKLADVCLMQASKKKITKTAALPLIPIAIVAAIIGAIYLKNHIAFHSDGFNLDFEKATKEIDDLINSNTNLGVGYSYRPEFIKSLSDLKIKLQQFHDHYQAMLPILDKMDQPKTGAELLEEGKNPDQAIKAAINQITTFREEAKNLYPYIRDIIRNFSDESYKSRQILDKGIFTKVVDVIPGAHGGAGLVADDFDDVSHALQTLMSDITNIMRVLGGAAARESVVKEKLSQVETESKKWDAQPEEKPAESPSEKAPWAQDEEDLAGLMSK